MDTLELKGGALIDQRSEAEKLKDFRFEEIVASAAPVNWVEKTPDQWRSFPIFDQGTSGSCVAQTLKKMLGVYIWLSTNYFVPLSASHIYQRRKNRPADGMGSPDAFEIVRRGTTLEQFAPSEKMNDAQMDNVVVKPFMEQIGTIFKIGNYITLPVGDIETVASIIQSTGKAVMVWFYFSSGVTPKEWVDVPVVQYPDLQINAPTGVARHSVAAVDFCLYKGKKALIIEDSWGLDKAIDGRRIITEDFFKKRNWFAAHFMNFAFEDQVVSPTPKPHHVFNVNLAFGQTSPEVKALQECLRYEGLFPANIVPSGYYGAITAKAVEAFQTKHGIAPTAPNNVGVLTRSALNLIYGQ
jgi:hypothetical protein